MWSTARKVCERESGELIKPDNTRINNWISNQTVDIVYIGANAQSDFETLSGSLDALPALPEAEPALSESL